jgi:peptidoglycan-N-acetylglucosamine deacetylase
MIRPLYFLLATVAVAVTALWIWPDHAHVHLPIVLGLHVGIGMWAVFSLRSGLLCRATWRSDTGRPEVALTYDDGPDPQATPALLDLLEERGVRATFFCVGEKVRANSELVRRMRSAGHMIGNHSNTHSVWNNFYFRRRTLQEVGGAQEAIAQAIGERPRYFRPPFGLSNHVTGAVAKELSLSIIGWQVRGYDLRGRNPQRVSRRILSRVEAGGVVLLHDGDREPGSVVSVTSAVLDGLEHRGLRPVTVEELLTE